MSEAKPHEPNAFHEELEQSLGPRARATSLPAKEETPMWLNPKKLAGDAVQRLADSEPTEDSIEGMERLRGTPQESMFVVDPAELQRVIECTLEDAVYDSPASSPSASEIGEAIGVLVRVCQHMGAMFVEKGVPLPELKDGERDLSISAARFRLEQLYREQQQEIERLRYELNEWKGARNALGDALDESRSQLARSEEYVVRLEKAFDRASEELASLKEEQLTPRINGITWLLIRDGAVLLERCPKKARVLGVGEWFVPGGKIEGDESPEQALIREVGEEWPGLTLLGCNPLPIVEGSPVPPTEQGIFLMRPFAISVAGAPPAQSADGIELKWTPLFEALESPVPQVRMMVAAALRALSTKGTEEK